MRGPDPAGPRALGCWRWSDQHARGRGAGSPRLQRQARVRLGQRPLPGGGAALGPRSQASLLTPPYSNGINSPLVPKRALQKVGLFHATEEGRWPRSPTAHGGDYLVRPSWWPGVPLDAFGVSPSRHTDVNKLAQTELGG